MSSPIPDSSISAAPKFELDAISLKRSFFLSNKPVD
jgi:hypothetical protein